MTGYRNLIAEIIKLSWLLVVLLVVVCVDSAHSSIPGPLRPYLFASQSGSHGFKLLPNKQEAGVRQKYTGVLFTLNPDGTEKEVWKHEMANVSSDVLVQSIDSSANLTATVVTISSSVLPSTRGCIVIYGFDGKIIRSLALAAIRFEFGAPLKPGSSSLSINID
jgi:hypothetical protein